MKPALLLLCITSVCAAQCVKVGAERIEARQLVSVDPLFAALPAETLIAYAPFPGQQRIVAADELRQLARDYNITAAPAHTICFEWELTPLAKSAVEAAMRAGLRLPRANVEIVALNATPMPPGELVFPPATLTLPSPANPDQPVLWSGYVVYAGKRRIDTWAKVRLQAETTRLVATEPLRPGALVRADQLRAEPYSGFPVPGVAGLRLEDVVGRGVVRLVAPGTVISSNLLVSVKEVVRGDWVKVEVRSGAARLDFEGIAESNGAMGEMVAVKNTASGKSFRAQVVQRGRVLVDTESLMANR
jgi:flagella basal body P-ring formation protein FlgA